MVVSVVIPVYNREFELRRAIQSVLNQTIFDFEILVIDDYSEIDIQAIIISYNDSRIKYFRVPKKGYANVCRNIGINSALGKYVAMLDSDDEWMPHHLESKIRFLEERNADGVFGSCCINNELRILDKISRPFHHNEKMVNYLLSDGMAPTPTHVYKTDCAKHILWDESLRRHQDWDFSVRFAKNYTFIPCYDISCIVHWKAGERREEHLDSLISFISKNQKDIIPKLYFNYHALFYRNLSTRIDIEEKYKRHYKQECLRYIEELSLVDFLSTFGHQKGPWKRLMLRIEFLIRVLFK
ncbi:MAG: glycosyltransferase family 2 protein [Bacteroidota bacterium]